MKQYKNTKPNDGLTIDLDRSLEDYFPNMDEEYVPKSNQIKSEFCRKIGELQTAGLNAKTMFDGGLAIAETLTLIYSQYKYVWSTIPYGKFDEMRQFVANNAFRYQQICNPGYHKMFLDIAVNGEDYIKNEEVKKYLFRYDITTKITPEEIVKFCVDYKNKFENLSETKTVPHYADQW